jgi:ribonuclease E
MVEKKEAEKKNKVVKIKATTGAWWKSTTTDDDSLEVEKPATSAKKKVSKAGKTTKSRKKPAPRRSAPKTKTAATKTAATKKIEKEVDPAQNEADKVVSEVAGESKAQEGKKSPKTGGRRGKKASPRKKSVKEPDSAVQDVPEQQKGDDEKETKKENEAGKKESTKKETKKVCKLLINAEEPEECRLALLEDGRLESIHVSTIGRTQTKNNIYKARIVAIEPSLQAAFVEYGTEKNGFLPFSEIHPEYYKEDLSDAVLRLVETHQWKKISITDVIEKGQEILAQVVKEEVGKKGANMTTYLSLPGRCVVLMPGSDSSGVSRKISGEEKRGQLRDIMNSLEIP